MSGVCASPCPNQSFVLLASFVVVVVVVRSFLKNDQISMNRSYMIPTCPSQSVQESTTVIQASTVRYNTLIQTQAS